jgi:hypothetical protein
MMHNSARPIALSGNVSKTGNLLERQTDCHEDKLLPAREAIRQKKGFLKTKGILLKAR